MVICAGQLDSVVPLENAMPGRVVTQWDKEDCADMKIIKIDLLGLGMMAALRDTMNLVKKHEGVELTLHCNGSRSFPPAFSEYFPTDFSDSFEPELRKVEGGRARGIGYSPV
jgi:Bacterial DNA polymerase III alpha NTPase domain